MKDVFFSLHSHVSFIRGYDDDDDDDDDGEFYAIEKLWRLIMLQKKQQKIMQ